MRTSALLTFTSIGLLLASCGTTTSPAVAPAAAQSTAKGNLSAQVIYGDSSSISKRPYQVALLYNGYGWCGGTLISKDWVLTAAHCVVGKTASSLKVRAGSTYNTSGGQLVSVASYTAHASYRDVTTGYDIAVIKLASPITTSSAVPAVVPGTTADATATKVGNYLVLSGWGRTSPYNDSYPSSLKEAWLPVVSASTCAAENGVYSVPSGTVCGGVNEYDQSGCNGDSGGPLASQGDNGKWYVFGIVSWGPVPDCNTAATVFTRAASYGTWIQQKTGIAPQN